VREVPLARDAVGDLAATLGETGAGKRVIDDLLDLTAARAPFLMRRVKRLIVQHAAYRKTLARLDDQIQKQLVLERTPGIEFDLDDRAIPLPPAFRAAYKRVFPDVHRRVWVNLTDKARTPEALAEVFVDFLVRWGEGFAGLESHHVEFLKELADRTCARLNGVPPETFVPTDDGDAEVPDVRRNRLGEDVLRTVDQELLRFARAGAAAG
jgi:hypothetical protein